LYDKIIEAGEYATYYTDGWPLDHIVSADPSVAVIENGNMIKGVAPGTVDITFYTNESGSDSGYNTCQLTVYALGDINNDTKIDAVDASGVLAEYARLGSSQPRQFNDVQVKAGDVDKNGKTDAVDASNILAYYAYTSTSHEDTKSLSEFISGR